MCYCNCARPHLLISQLYHHCAVIGGPNVSPGPTEFSSGDVVQVELDVEVFMLLQEDHGGWNDSMKTVRMLIFKSRSNHIS